MNSSWALLAVFGLLLASFIGVFSFRTKGMPIWGARTIIIAGFVFTIIGAAFAQGGDMLSIAVCGVISLIPGVFTAVRLVPGHAKEQTSQLVASPGPEVSQGDAANPVSEAICFTFTPTADDYVTCMVAGFRRRIPGLWLGRVFAMFILVLGVIAAVSASQINGAYWKTLPLIVLPVFFLALPFLWRYNLARQVKAHDRLRAECRFQVSDAGWTITNKFSETKLDWGTFAEALETRTHFLIFYSTSPNVFQIVPRRAFSSVESETEFRDLLSRHLQLRRSKR